MKKKVAVLNHPDGVTFYVDLLPQTTGAMGHENIDAWQSRMILHEFEKGGLSEEQAIKFMQHRAKQLSEATFEKFI